MGELKPADLLKNTLSIVQKGKCSFTTWFRSSMISIIEKETKKEGPK
jgi:hypothetical protein